MKLVWDLLPPFIKGAVTVIVFFVSLGWASYGAVLLIVKAEGQEIRREIKEIRLIDIQHLDKRFDTIEKLIKEERK